MELILTLITELLFDYWIYLIIMINTLCLADIYGRIL